MRSQRFLLAVLTLGAAAVVATPSSPASAATTVNGESAGLIVGTGNGAAPHVKTLDAVGNELGGFYASDPSINSGACVASGDVDGDLKADIVTGTGPGTPSLVTVHDLNGTPRGSFSPYGAFKGGVNVAVGDVDGDTKAEIITGADAGGGPHVIVWDFDNGVATAKFGWFPYDQGFKGGVSVATADLVGSTKADIVTGAGPGGGPHVIVWDVGSGTPQATDSFFAYGQDFHGGVKVAAGELNNARVIVTGAGSGGGPHVKVFSQHGVEKAGFFAYEPGFTGGVNVAVVTNQGGDPGHIVTAPIMGGGPHVRGFTPDGTPIPAISFYAYAPGVGNGVNIAAVPVLGTQNNTNQNG